jgi:hypothetical protein
MYVLLRPYSWRKMEIGLGSGEDFLQFFVSFISQFRRSRTFEVAKPEININHTEVILQQGGFSLKP